MAFIAIPIFLQMKPVKGNSTEKIARVDWIGSFLFIASITAILIPVTWVSNVLDVWYVNQTDDYRVVLCILGLIGGPWYL